MPVRRLTEEERPVAGEVVSGGTADNFTISPQVAQGQLGTIGATWEVDGTEVDPGTVTLTMVNDAGVTLVSNAATVGSPGPTRYYVLSPAQTVMLDRLVCTWTAQNGSVIQTYVDIVGGFCCSVAQLRKQSPLQDTNAYPTEALLWYRMLAEQSLEDICGVAFVPRYSREKARASRRLLTVSRRKVRTVRQISTTATNGVQQNLSNLSGLRVVGTDQISMPGYWSWLSLPIYVAYEHGYDRCPARVSNAVQLLTKRWIIESPWDERTTGFRTREGGEMSILTTSHTEPFDIPEVVTVADAYGTPFIGM